MQTVQPVKSKKIDSSSVGVTSGSIARSENRGVYATFLKVGNRGLKCYNSPESRDQHYRYQRTLANKGLAPYCDDCVDMTLPDGSVKYAYWSGLAEVAMDRYDGELFVNNEDCRDLKARLGDAGYDWHDDHSGNWGYVNGRAVLIDCSGY